MESSPTYSSADTRMLSEILRPRNIGDILDATIRLYRRHFLLYFSIALSVQVVIFIASLAFSVPMNQFQRSGGFGNPGAGQPDMDALLENPALIIALVLGFTFTMAAYVVGTQLQQGALIVAVSQTFLGEESTVGDAFSAVFSRFGTLFGYGILSTLLGLGVLIGGSAIGIIPLVFAPQLGTGLAVVAVLFGLGLIFLAFVAMLYVVLALVMGPQAIMLEGAGVGEAFSRSWYMMRKLREPGLFNGNIVRVGFILTIIGILQGMVVGLVTVVFYVGAGLIGVLWGGLDFQTFATAPPLYIQIPLGLMQSVLGAAVLPLGLIALILFYYDIRIRFEGFDLQVLSDALDSR